MLSHRSAVYRFCGAALIFLSVVLVYRHGISSWPSRPNTTSSSEKPQGLKKSYGLSSWKWSVERDAMNYGLTEAQCDAAFPGLWNELERAVDLRRKVGNITEKDVEISWRKQSMVRAMIYNRQVSRLGFS
jgi:hypothetical protein